MGLAEIAPRAPAAWAADRALSGSSPLRAPAAWSPGRARVVPAIPPLDRLFPEGGPRRGSTLTVAGAGSTSLAFALAAGASARGGWTAAVGPAGLGLLAAAELGVDLARFAVVRGPGEHWPTAVAALVDAFDVVLGWPPPRLRADEARRLAARARERGAVLVAVGAWPGPADHRLTVTATGWEGLDAGYGRLRARTAEVAAVGKGAAARERRVVWATPGEAADREVVPLRVPEAG